jgi:hypothetical protein
VGNNSPFALSCAESRSRNDWSDESDESDENSDWRRKRLTVGDVTLSMSRFYDDFNKYSNEIDILIAYVRSLRSVHAKALWFTNQTYYGLTVTAILLSALVTIVNPFLNRYDWNVYAISGINALATFLISLTYYLNSLSRIHAFSFMTTAYEKFETSLEMTNNAIAFVDDRDQIARIVLEKIKEIEIKINDVRDIGQQPLPVAVQRLYPVSSQIHIFSFIKKMETHKRSLMVKYADLKNEMNMLYRRVKRREVKSNKGLLETYHKRLVFLNDIKGPLKQQLIDYHDAYTQLEYLFTKEVQYADRYSFFYFCLGAPTPSYLDESKYSNPVIIDYLRLLRDPDSDSDFAIPDPYPYSDPSPFSDPHLDDSMTSSVECSSWLCISKNGETNELP